MWQSNYTTHQTPTLIVSYNHKVHMYIPCSFNGYGVIVYCRHSLPAVKISPVVDTTTSVTPSRALRDDDDFRTNHASTDDRTTVTYASASEEDAAADPLVHWSDVMPTLDLPPPATGNRSQSSAPTTMRHHHHHHHHEELETFACDMELLGDFLMDAMADHDEASTAVAPAQHAQQHHHYYHHHHHEEDDTDVLDVEQQLPPPPLLLPPPVAQ